MAIHVKNTPLKVEISCLSSLNFMVKVYILFTVIHHPKNLRKENVQNSQTWCYKVQHAKNQWVPRIQTGGPIRFQLCAVWPHCSATVVEWDERLWNDQSPETYQLIKK